MQQKSVILCWTAV